MTRDEAEAMVERARGRKCYVDPVGAAIAPSLFTAMGLSTLSIWGIAIIAWWGIILGTAAVFGAVWLHTRQANESMRRQVNELVTKGVPFDRIL